MIASTDLPSLRSEIQHRLDLYGRIGHHSVVAGITLRVQRYLAAIDAGNSVAANAELACLRYLVGGGELPPPEPWWRAPRCLVLIACTILLVFAISSAFALRLRVTDAEVQLEICRRGHAE